MRKRFFVVGGLALVVLALVATHSAAGPHEPRAASMGDVVVAVCLAIGETAVASLLAAALRGARASARRGALAPLTGAWSDGAWTGEPPMRARDGPILQTFLL